MEHETLTFCLAGASLGLSAGLSPGPLLSLVLAQAVSHGTREGIKVALSPLVTDAPILLATWLVLSRLTGRPAILGLIALVGAGVLTRYAWDCFRPRRPAPDAPARVPHSLRRGVVANFCNPHPYLFWAAVGMPTLLAAARVGPATPILFLATFYATIVSAKICIAVLAGRFRIFLASRAYRLLMAGLGLSLLAFAAAFARQGLAMLF